MVDPNLPASTPGWYPDPSGQHGMRYWDGRTWTEAVSDLPPPGVQPLAAQPPGVQPPGVQPLVAQAPSARTPARMLWIVGVAAFTVLAVVAGLLIWITTRPAPSPQAFTAVAVDGNAVTLHWQAPQGDPPEAYLVTRNGADVARVQPGQDYTDSGLIPVTAYRYSVRGVRGSDESRPTPEIAVTTLPWGPDELTAGTVSSTAVTLTWQAPEGDPPEQFVVQREGTDLTTVPGTATDYTDESVDAGATLHYTVIAVQRGQRSKPSPEVVVKTVDPPVADARLVGTWVMDATVHKNNGTRLKIGDVFGEEWTFTPACAAGACPVTLKGTMGNVPIKATLTRKGANYTGSTTASITTCNGKHVTNTLAITVTVTKAEVAEGLWRTTDWGGALTMYSPYTVSGNFFCRKQNAVFALASGVGPT